MKSTEPNRSIVRGQKLLCSDQNTCLLLRVRRVAKFVSLCVSIKAGASFSRELWGKKYVTQKFDIFDPPPPRVTLCYL